MEFYILESINLERVGLLDDVLSAVWNNKYFSCGDFSVIVEATKENIEIIKKNYFVVRKDVADEIGIIETISISEKENKKTIVFTGRFAQSVLARRVIWASSLLNGNLLQQLRELIKVNAIECKDENGKALPERNLIVNMDKVAMIGSSIIRPENANMELISINAGVNLERNGGGYKYPFQYSSPYLVDFDNDLSLTWSDPHTNRATVCFLGDMIKNPLTGLADVIVQKGNKYIKKERNVYIGDFRGYLAKLVMTVYSQYFGVLVGLSNVLPSNAVITVSGIGQGILMGRAIPYKFFSPTGDKNPIYTDLGFAVNFGKNIFCDKVKIKTERNPEDKETFLYYKDGILWFANVLNNGAFTPQLEAFHKMLEQLPDDVQFVYSHEEEKEKDTGLLVSQEESGFVSYSSIPATSPSYDLFFSRPLEHEINTLLQMEATTYNDNVNSYIEIGESLPENNTIIYEIVKGDNLLEFTEKNLQSRGLSIRAIYSRENNKITLSFYEGKNRTKGQSENDQVVFSKDLDTLTGFNATESTQGKANVSRVSGKKDNIEKWTTTGAGAGLNRHERYEDVGDLSTFADIDHIRALQSSGDMALLGYHAVIDAEIDASLYKYRKDYYLGDIVSVDIKDLTLQYDARVLEVCETYDASGYQLSLILGK